MTIKDIYKDSRFERYYQLLVEWNNKFNLTSVTERDEVFLKHFYDSVLPLSDNFEPPLFGQNASVLDVGSGAGFPGICLKLLRPDLDITLIETVGKKVTFLDAVLSDLKLSDIRAVKSRIEDFKKRDFDHVTARAVAPLSTLAEYGLPFLKIGGTAVFYKSATAQDEIDNAKKAISFLGGEILDCFLLPLNEDITRSFVVIKKVTATKAGYPRGGNKPRLSPI